MTTSLLPNRHSIYDIEQKILVLEKQNSIIQNIENERPDFADLIETCEVQKRAIKDLRRYLKLMEEEIAHPEDAPETAIAIYQEPIKAL